VGVGGWGLGVGGAGSNELTRHVLKDEQQLMRCLNNSYMSVSLKYTGCGKLTSFFEYEMPYKKGSYLAAPCIRDWAPRVWRFKESNYQLCLLLCVVLA
jgi:hypothetical protein